MSIYTFKDRIKTIHEEGYDIPMSELTNALNELAISFNFICCDINGIDPCYDLDDLPKKNTTITLTIEI